MVTDNFTLEVFRFKMRLVDAGLTLSEAEAITDKFKKKAQEIIEAAMSAGLDEAITAGVEKRSADFLNDIKPDDSRFEITTLSGRKDYSIDPFSMKAGLLHNAKTSKDGTRYKVIPVGKESVNKPSFLSLDGVHQERAKQLKNQLEARRDKALHKPAHQQEFRTVTDKQPATSWKHPGFNRDMTADLSRINANIKQQIEVQIKELMAEFEQRAQGGI